MPPSTRSSLQERDRGGAGAMAGAATRSGARVRSRGTGVPMADPQAIDAFFARLARARRRVLMLDYDGTLAPFHVDRLAAHPYPGAREILARLRLHPATRMLFVSGRPAREMADMLQIVPRPDIWGAHGWERLTESGQLLRSILPSQARAALQKLAALEPQLAAAGARLEQKYAAVAVHLRGLDEGRRAQAQALLSEFAGGMNEAVFLQEFDGGVELRAHGPSKGSVVRGVLREEPRDSVIAYLGDDLTDEDAFLALGTRGLSVRVLTADATDERRARPSAAQLALQAPAELLEFLARWNATPPA